MEEDFERIYKYIWKSFVEAILFVSGGEVFGGRCISLKPWSKFFVGLRKFSGESPRRKLG